ncbi:putative protein-serine/threonine phosphatase KNAG_0D01960 [Huiozyma naganishii CBS 8797]|uniref:RTR1-type domain-containing protein n=1 Tax=Huiozyma naganishii (strain ATCC MYA-139 / BCRC 22969 / CBS 8797 / KCTC 17520 / NBRC 10181 / NCYC 3082 / Yp74L-3) TaxID=1071383 RepID=J7RXW1_HUIN7|nr:hypothetical protein KNAG_0D01960 [Kazachstania naganishii CBS 8797]CCK69947.1 hypothetical protein KNAG_0D01960 [Kazachstania naganishii CBS 8797]
MNAVTVKDVYENALLPHQLHAQLSEREGQLLTNEITALLSDSYCIDDTTLKFISPFYTLSDYKTLNLVRNSRGRCAYPLCDKFLNGGSVTAEFSGSMLGFCSGLHYDCNNYILNQLSDDPPIYLRERIHMVSRFDFANMRKQTYQVELFEDYLKKKATEYDMDTINIELDKFRMSY